MISYCHKLDVCLCVSLLLVYPDETASEWRTFGMADRYPPTLVTPLTTTTVLLIGFNVSYQQVADWPTGKPGDFPVGPCFRNFFGPPTVRANLFH